MRLHAIRALGGLLALAGVSKVVLAPSIAFAGSADLVQVYVDKARLVRIPETTQTLVVGQPGVADVTMLRNSGMSVITGKSFGETNLIALDARGALLGEWLIRVSADSNGLLVQNGLSRETYICQPLCLPTVDLADAKTIVGDRAAAVSAHASFSGAK